MKSKVWLIGGTSDSAAIARKLAGAEIGFTISVATTVAPSLYDPQYKIVVGSMDYQQMELFCLDGQIEAIIDASHPYAVQVSLQAIAVAEALNIPYLRYERDSYQNSELQNFKLKNSDISQADANIDININANIIELDSFDQLLTGKYLQRQRVLLTVGCKVLPLFKSWQDKATLYARFLPKLSSLTTALEAGFTSDRLIAMRPPINLDLEKALWQQWDISLVVTKASGKAGGEATKRQLAADLNIPLIVVTRPLVAYPLTTSVIDEVLVFCQNLES